ncbi:MAG: hypothetical protein HY743_02230 [Deltaproteobacteria bacterium]|nr:hypothetical protein [Deltaproteobacteria bacterium]
MRPRFFASMILVCLLACSSAPALAYTVHLDGVVNATWSDNPTTYLYVAHADSSGYYYQWNYGTGTLPWTSRQNLVDDLGDNVLNNAGNIPVGDWKVESGGDPFHPSSTIMKTLALTAGTYTLRLTSDSEAYNLKSYQWPNETPADLNVWNAYVEILAVYKNDTNESFQFGGYTGYWQTNEADALAYYRANVDNKKITLAYDADLFFYINDWNTVDNAKSVTLEIVPLPGSLALLGPGLAMLLAGNFWRRKRG